MYVWRSENVINRIIMKNVASYKENAILETDKRVKRKDKLNKLDSKKKGCLGSGKK